MIEREWGNDEWDTLIRTISKGNCILMLGPDASCEEIDGKMRPLSEMLAKELVENEKVKATLDVRRIDPANLAQVAQCYLAEVGRNGLEAKAETFYEKRFNLTSDLHRDLTALPFNFTVTSTPDRMFYNAQQDSGKKPVIMGYNFRGEKLDMVGIVDMKEPLIFNLYGNFNDSYSLVLTENDLIDFLVAVAAENPALPKDVISELRASNKSFLFLGFGFKHWYLRILLHVLQGDKKKDAHSYALEECPRNEEEFQQAVFFFESSDCKIRLYSQELKTFVKELRRRWEEGPGRVGESPPPPPPKAPSVFICHASEDKEFADFLYKKIKAAGFDPWLDKESLRGGDRWDKVIKEAIGKEIDYVVVVQSAALAAKIEGYVHKEIKLALERQDKFSLRISFIIPVKIEDSPLLEELELLHTIDLSNRENVTELIKTIQRDQSRRRRDQQ